MKIDRNLRKTEEFGNINYLAFQSLSSLQPVDFEMARNSLNVLNLPREIQDVVIRMQLKKSERPKLQERLKELIAR